jgi:hypothetical protein
MRKWSIALALAASTAVGAFTVYTPASHAADRREHRRDVSKEDAGWVKLGEREVNWKVDHDVIDVGRQEGKFSQLRLRCTQGDLELYKMRIYFVHGDPFTPDTKVHFHEGERTHSIDLPGDARTIKKVEFSYRSESRHDPAVIELLGKEAH